MKLRNLFLIIASMALAVPSGRVTATESGSTSAFPWVDSRSFVNLSSVVTSSGTIGKKIIISTRQVVDTLTIPGDRVIEVIPGGSIEVAKGHTLTINGPFHAGLLHVFHGEGMVRFGPRSIIEAYPQWFGAQGNGVADDTKAVQAAVSAWTTVRFPAGRYPITSVNIPGGRYLYGDYANSVIYSSDSTSNVLQLTGGEVTIEHLRFAHNSDSGRSGGAFIDTGRSSLVTIRHCFFSHGFIGVRTASTLFTMEDCDLRDFSPGGTCIEINDGYNVYLDRIRTDHKAPYPAYGVRITATGDTTISNSNLIHSGTGLSINPPAGKVVASVYASNTFFDTATYGIRIEPAGGSVVRSHFVNCWTSSHARTGTTIDGSKGLVDGMTFVNLQSNLNAENGVTILGEHAKNISFLGGEIAENKGSGFFVGNGVSRFYLQNLMIGAVHGLKGNMQGVTIGRSCREYVVRNNDIRGNQVSQFLDNSLTGIIEDNTGVRTNNSGSSLIPAGALSVVVPHGLIAAPRPSDIFISPTSGHGSNAVFVDTTTITSSSFTVRCSAPATNNYHFSWTARVEHHE